MPALPSSRSLRFTVIACGSFSPGFAGWTTITSFAASDVGDPASASASSRVIVSPVNVTFCGARTAPVTTTLRALYCSMPTSTCGFLIQPFCRLVVIRLRSSSTESPAAGMRPRYGSVIDPSVSTRYFAVRSLSSITVIMSVSCGPITYWSPTAMGAGCWPGAAGFGVAASGVGAGCCCRWSGCCTRAAGAAAGARSIHSVGMAMNRIPRSLFINPRPASTGCRAAVLFDTDSAAECRAPGRHPPSASRDVAAPRRYTHARNADALRAGCRRE